MKPVYLGHSGFLVETADSYYIFDYYKGGLPELDASKPVVVFVSHGHHDHYNPEVFDLLRAQGMERVLAVLAKDIPQHKYPQGVEVVRASANSTYALPGGEAVETLLSTDSGVAYLVTAAGGVIYHGGDLNDWTWEEESDSYNRQMRGSYRHEIDKLRGRRVDLAFAPLDPRQEKHCAAGLLYFLDRVDAAAVYPMHYWEKPQVIERFLTEYPSLGERVRNTEEIGL